MKKILPVVFIIAIFLSYIFSGTLSAQHSVSTLCGTSVQGNPLSGPNGICISPNGTTLYVADYTAHKIKKVMIASGTVTNLAGNGTIGYNDGAASTSQFSYPSGIKISSDGMTLYISDNGNCLIRKIDLSNNMVTTIAGVYNAFAFGDSSDGHQAKFNQPIDIAIAPGDSVLYISDSENHVIRKINLVTTAVSTIAGTPGSFGSADGTGSAASFHNPNGIALSADGQALFVADAGNNKIRKINLGNSSVATIAGNGIAAYIDNPDGLQASFNIPQGVVAFQGNSFLFVTDTYNNRIRLVDLNTSAVSTVAGSTSTSLNHFADNTNGLSAKFYHPVNAVLSLSSDKLFISDQENFRVRTMMTDIPTSTGEQFQSAISSVCIYPNPVNDFLMLEIELGDKKELSYKIISIDGKKIFDSNQIAVSSGKNSYKVFCRNLKPGNYLIQGTMNDKRFSYQFLKI